MKQITKSILMAAALGLASVGTASASSTGVGTWSMGYDWYCDGSYSKTTWTLNADGTFNTTAGYSGTWFRDQSFITVRYSSGTTYTGTHIQKSMTGVQRSYNGLQGCWYAHPNDGYNYDNNTDTTADNGVDEEGGSANSRGRK